MPYPSDLSDTEWLLVEDLFAVGNYGTSRKHSIRDLELVFTVCLIV